MVRAVDDHPVDLNRLLILFKNRYFTLLASSASLIRTLRCDTSIRFISFQYTVYVSPSVVGEVSLIRSRVSRRLIRLRREFPFVQLRET